MKPWLLMDVDGPLNPYDAPWFDAAEPATGYCWHQLKPSGDRSYRVALNSAHGARLIELATSFQLAWATVWGDDGNRLIASLLGLPNDLPVLPLVRPDGAFFPRRSWKTDQIASWVGPRPFAWFDDEINRATRDWLLRVDGMGPHLAIRVPAHVGLTAGDFDQIEMFASNLEGFRS